MVFGARGIGTGTWVVFADIIPISYTASIKLAFVGGGFCSANLVFGTRGVATCTWIAITCMPTIGHAASIKVCTYRVL